MNEYKYEIDKLRDEIKEVNRKYYEQKKREKLEREMQKVFKSFLLKIIFIFINKNQEEAQVQNQN